MTRRTAYRYHLRYLELYQKTFLTFASGAVVAGLTFNGSLHGDKRSAAALQLAITLLGMALLFQLLCVLCQYWGAGYVYGKPEELARHRQKVEAWGKSCRGLLVASLLLLLLGCGSLLMFIVNNI